MFATLLSVLRLATRVPSSGINQHSTDKSPSNPIAGGDFPETHMHHRRDTIRVYPSPVQDQGPVLPSSQDLSRLGYSHRLIAAVADGKAVISTASAQPSQPILIRHRSRSGTLTPSLGSRSPCAMPRTHGLDSLLHLHIGDRTHSGSRWTPRRLFSRKSFTLEEVIEHDHENDNDHDSATLLGEDSPLDDIISEKRMLTPPPADIDQLISRKIVDNQDDLLEPSPVIPEPQDFSNFDWAFSHLAYDSDENDPDSSTYYSPSDDDFSGPHTPLELAYPSSCCIPAHVLLQRLIEAHPDSEESEAKQVLRKKTGKINEQKLVEVDDEGQELWVTVLTPAPRAPHRRAKIIRKRGDGAELCPVHKCDLPCVPCDPTVIRHIEF